MKIVERSVSAGGRPIFDLDEFLSRPLYARLAHSSEHGPRESPVRSHRDGQATWIVAGTSSPGNLKRDPRRALGIVDWAPATGLSHHVGMRGKAEAPPFDRAMARAIFRRYFGPDEGDWDPRFDYAAEGQESGLTMVRITPETAVVRDQAYKPTRWARQAGWRPRPAQPGATAEGPRN